MASAAAELSLLIGAKNTTGPSFKQVQNDLRRMQEAMADRAPAKALQAEILRVGEAFKNAGSDMEKARLREQLQGLQSELKGLRAPTDKATEGMSSLIMQGAKLGLGAIGVLGVVDGVKRLGSSLMDTAGNMQKLGMEVHTFQEETGATAETASGLLAVFARYDVSAETASRSLGIFSKGLRGVIGDEEGGKDASAAFAKSMDSLGISAHDAAGNVKPMNELLFDVADKFKAMPDGIEKTADSMALFGRGGKAMISVLNEGGAGMKDLMAAAERYGIILDEKTVQSVRQLSLNQRDLDAATKGVSVQIGLTLLPVLTKLASQFAEELPKAMAEARPAVDLLTVSVDMLTNAFAALGTVSGMSLGQLKKDFDWLLGPAGDFIESQKEWQGFWKTGTFPSMAKAQATGRSWLEGERQINAATAGPAARGAPSGQSAAWEMDRLNQMVKVGIDLTKAREKARQEAESAAKSAASKAKSDAESAAKKVEAAIEAADKAMRQYQIDVIRAGESTGKDWKEATVKAATEIKAVQDDAAKSIREMEQGDILQKSIRARKQAFDEGQQMASLERSRKLQDAETEKQYRRELAGLDSDSFEQRQQRASTERSRKLEDAETEKQYQRQLAGLALSSFDQEQRTADTKRSRRIQDQQDELAFQRQIAALQMASFDQQMVTAATAHSQAQQDEYNQWTLNRELAKAKPEDRAAIQARFQDSQEVLAFQRAQQDEDRAWQLAQDKMRIDQQHKIALADMATRRLQEDDDRQWALAQDKMRIDQQHKIALADMSVRRLQEDDDRAWKQTQEIASLEYRHKQALADLSDKRKQEDDDRAWKQTQDKAVQDFEDGLAAEAMNRERVKIESERDFKIEAINKGYNAQLAAISLAHAAAMTAIREEANMRINEANKAGANEPLITDPFANVDREHAPGGAIFDPWWSSINEAQRNDFRNEHPDWGLAEGGIVTRPTWRLFGEAGAEAVIPLSKMGSVGGETFYVTITGPIYGEMDFQSKVVEAVVMAKRRGRL